MLGEILFVTGCVGSLSGSVVLKILALSRGDLSKRTFTMLTVLMILFIFICLICIPVGFTRFFG